MRTPLTRQERNHRPRHHRPRLEALEGRSLLSGAGSLDATFGGTGVVTNSKIGGGYNGSTPGAGVALQADGKIDTIGVVTSPSGINSAAVIRYNPDGSVDTGFGSGGTATAQLSKKLNARPYAVALQRDGKILVAGQTDTGTTAKSDFFLARFTAGGALDASFGSGGVVHTDFGNSNDQANAICVQPDGRIVLGGSGGGGPAVLARYNANGSLDATFGSGGMARFGGDASRVFNRVDALALQADGKIVASGLGYPANSTTQWSFAVARFLANGTPDASFSSGGLVLTNPSGLSDSRRTEACAVAIQADGKIVAAGITVDSGPAGVYSDEIGLVRYNVGVAGQPDGSLDTTFGQNGVAVLSSVPAGSTDGYAVAIQADGKIVVAGDETGPDAFLLARYNVGVAGQADGTLDPTFGQGGFVTTVGPGNTGQATALAIYPASDPVNGGKIVAAGSYYSGSKGLMLARYQGAASAALHATSLAPVPVHQSLTPAEARPALVRALSSWRARGAHPARLGRVRLAVADLGGSLLGEASGRTITLDDNAAGWGWVIGPGRRRPGRMDLAAALEHEVGHLLGHGHSEGGVMAETLTPGVPAPARPAGARGRRRSPASPSAPR